jgi:hypothetical protein
MMLSVHAYVDMLTVVMPSVVMLSVVVPFFSAGRYLYFLTIFPFSLSFFEQKMIFIA